MPFHRTFHIHHISAPQVAGRRYAEIARHDVTQQLTAAFLQDATLGWMITESTISTHSFIAESWYAAERSNAREDGSGGWLAGDERLTLKAVRAGRLQSPVMNLLPSGDERYSCDLQLIREVRGNKTQKISSIVRLQAPVVQTASLVQIGSAACPFTRRITDGCPSFP